MDRITLDFDGIRSKEELHARLREVFSLPGWYGNNLDALWDCLYHTFPAPVTIRLKNVAALPPELGAVSAGLLRLFRDLAERDGNVSIAVLDEGGGRP